ncbi:DNA gyrase subunit A [BD1-7 clade bacterium]|uniref:DNA gyrase subunit A n=1 Tax=BD1-7 clade bacterium TaxID=2029982 RepID=A0A5S9PA53_9GAMM|nr:DNA gyrase subunit A [BD1-7 clade bacterium]
MSEISKQVAPVNIEDELKQSYLDYAMSVIVGRALPDVRDGMKPVHRRVLFAMDELGNDWNKSYKKSARVVGDVIGKYHPHGDTAVYDTIVRMAQPFSLRYMLVDGQGNFGSVDGDSPAAMRYTEIRMRKISHEMLEDLDKETVDFVPNYDGTEQIPSVLPTKVPNLLVNGSSGIAVGMATNIPPHNLGETIDACLAYMDDPEIGIDGLMEHIPGPDFPTAAIINGRAGILQAYRTGRGRIYMRARAEVEVNEKNSRETIIITELPYQLNKARLIEKIAELVKEKKIEGISELRDESDSKIRVVIELKRGESGEVVLNNLYTQTQLQTVFGINMVALVDGQPKLLNLKEIIEAFVKHRREVVTRRTVYLLRKARERGHLLEGLAVAIANIDPIITTIKASQTTAEAKANLLAKGWATEGVVTMLERAGEGACRPEGLSPEFGFRDGKYYLSPEQAQSILDMRLQKLTGLEHDKLLTEFQEKLEQIAEYLFILGDADRLMEVIREEIVAIKEEYNDVRRTEILSSQLDLTHEDLINEEDRVVTLSHGGYAKTQPLEDYQAQRRGGKGKSATAVKDEDFVEHLLIANTHDTILCFSNRGKVYWLKVYQIPVASRQSRGRPIVNLLPLEEGERITSILPVTDAELKTQQALVQSINAAEDAEGQEIPAENGSVVIEGTVVEPIRYITMATQNGVVKKTTLASFARQRSSGLIALSLDDGDVLVATSITDGSNDIVLVSSSGKVNRFSEEHVRAMGRTSRGVRGIKMAAEHKLISMIVPQENGKLLTVSERGYGKRTAVEDFPCKGRATQGVIGMQCSDRNGQLVGAVQVFDGDELMMISNQGTLVRTHTEQISVLGRNTQGVRLIKVAEDEILVGVARIEEADVDEKSADGAENGAEEGAESGAEGTEGTTPTEGGEAADDSAASDGADE